jgi:hypothetical protein
MNIPSNVAASPLRQQAANTLLRARKLPPGPHRNDLRQLGVGLLSLYKKGFRANVRISDENAIDRSLTRESAYDH